ncbi:MAG TPA: hypothetical protein ENN40_06750 [Candidatus Aminicenantes bacterium]|nr:hypothetical protein [Candidatus Aminicenantes bacterium]
MKKGKTAVFLVWFVAFALGLCAQYGYYGKNKVRLSQFNWQYVESENFRVYYYTERLDLIRFITRSAEGAYSRISKFLNVQVEDKIPLIFYRSHIDFEQTNLFPGFLPIGVQAFAEPVAQRVVCHGDMAPEELARTITHELGHIFEFQILFKGVTHSSRALRAPPLWIMEGFSEYVTENWNSFSLMTVRDSVLNDNIAELEKDWNLKSASATGRTPYDMGHLIYEFIEHRYGKRAIRNLLESIRPGSLLGKRRDPFKFFGTSSKEFNFEFKKFARDRFRDFMNRENPEDYSFPIGPEYPPYAYAFSHRISPTGELLAVLTAHMKRRKLEMVLVSMKDGKVIKNITPGFTSRYDFIEYQFDPADGPSFTWDRRGEKLAFFARKEFKNYLVVMDAASGDLISQLPLPEIDAPSSPTFLPDNRTIWFTAVKDSIARIYEINIEKGVPRPLSDNSLFIRALDISKDGKEVVFSARSGQHFHIYTAKLNNLSAPVQLTRGKSNDISPFFSEDGRFIYFSSDDREAFNICGIDRVTRIRHRYSDVRTGNFFPIQIPGSPAEVVISSFHKGLFTLYRKNIAVSLEQEPLPDPSPPASQGDEDTDRGTIYTSRLGPAFRTPEIEIEEKGDYKPFKELYIDSLPNIGVGYSTDGNFLGYTYLQASDLMGDHNLSLFLATQYGYRSFRMSYMNLTHRLQYYASLFSWNDGYYYYTTRSYFSLRKRFGLDLGILYPFSRSTRLTAGASFYRQEEDSDLIYLQRKLPYGQYFSGYAMPLTLSLTGETTRFAAFGPLMGHTFDITFQKFLNIGDSFQDAYTLTADFRKYLHLDTQTLLAFRLRGFTSGGENPMLFWMGGDNTIRSSEYARITGNHGFHFNAEFRFSLIHLAATPLGLIGPVRGVFFFDLGGAWYNDQDFRLFKPDGGLQLQDGISSYGFGIQAFLFGVPMHFEWVRRWDFRESYYYGFNFWIGFDF